MRTKNLSLVLCLLLLSFALLLTACGNAGDDPGSTTAPHAHAYGEWAAAKAATCTEEGSEERVCACGEKETRPVAALGHTEVSGPFVSPTCTSKGKTEGKYCSVCNAVIVQQTDIPAKGHAFGQWATVKTATCAEEGSQERVCVCGEKETQTLKKAPHTYTNGLCVCGDSQYGGVLQLIEGINPQDAYWSNGKVIAVKQNDQFYIIDNTGKPIAGPFNSGIICPDMAGYIIGRNAVSTVIGSTEDYWGDMVDIVELTTVSSVYAPDGTLVFQTTCVRTDSFDTTTYEGEYVINCSEDRIITAKYYTYWLGMARNYYTMCIYDMNGMPLAEYRNVAGNGTYINGQLVFMAEGKLTVLDKNAHVVTSVALYELLPDPESEIYIGYDFPVFGLSFFTANFSNGYLLIGEEYAYQPYAALIRQDLKMMYVLDTAYLYNKAHYGTLLFSKIVENGQVSSGYYLIDVSKCPLDEKGCVLPVRSAVLNSTEFSVGSIYNIYGQAEKYMLVSDAEGNWGYLSNDGKTLVMYEDAANFSGGLAAVKEKGEIYVINDKLERVSNGLTGFDGVSASGNGVFVLIKDGVKYLAVYTP